MKRTLLVTVLTIGLLAAHLPAADSYSIDASHSSVVFEIKHLNIAPFFGRFNTMEGTVVWDSSNPAASSIELKIDAASVDTANEKRDQHLRSNDFFSVKRYPAITFKSKKIEKVNGDTYRVTGDLTLHGRTKEITTEFVKTGEGDDPWGGYRVGGMATLTIDRTEFGMEYMANGGGLGNEVTLHIAIEAVRKK